MIKVLLAVVLAFTGYPAAVSAADLSIGLSATVTSLDPHAINLTPNNNIAEQIFDPLVRRDAKLRPLPGLAESWHRVDDLTWQFRLRRGVTFHDGSALTADDVVFSLERPKWLSSVPKASVGVLTYTQAITQKTAVDPWTIQLKTATPYPYLVHDLMGVMIVSRAAARDKHGADFNNSSVAQGTGPFRLERYAPGERIVLKRNDRYWGAKSPWETVTFRLLPDDATRLATLLSGAVDLIEGVPTGDIARLRKDARIRVVETTSNRLVHLQLDSHRDQSPFVSDASGKPLERNPLKDVRVRKAISMAINRDAIVTRVMDGLGKPAGQVMPDGFVAWSPRLKPEPHKPDEARSLLAAAGYPNGFGLTLHAPNDRLVKGTEVVQAIAQNLARVGINVRVEAVPYSVYIARARKFDVSAVLQSWGAINEATIPLRFVAITPDPQKGLGAFNFGRYSNLKADAIFHQALSSFDDSAREKLLQETTEHIINDYGIIPLHFQVNTWAMRRPLDYAGRGDERTYAHEVQER